MNVKARANVIVKEITERTRKQEQNTECVLVCWLGWVEVGGGCLGMGC